LKIRDVIKLVERHGWRLKNQEGSHRQYVHPTTPGKVTIAGHSSAEMPRGTLQHILKQAGIHDKP
jgi:predicted RNA binding protein YcfA (HicA-like mRNA interferase family)